MRFYMSYPIPQIIVFHILSEHTNYDNELGAGPEQAWGVGIGADHGGISPQITKLGGGGAKYRFAPPPKKKIAVDENVIM